MEKDYYKILGVARTASEDEIKAAYRELAKTEHPYKRPDDPHAEHRFAEINEAGSVLRDKDKRAAYDEKLRAAEKPEPPRVTPSPRQNPARESPPSRPSNEEQRPINDPTGLIDALFNRRVKDPISPSAARAQQPDASHTRQTADAPADTIPINVTLEEAYRGSQRSHKVETRITCPNCRGTGRSARGQTGLTIGVMQCATCLGKRTVRQTETVPVTISPGVRQGTKLRVPGNAKRGELLFEVRLQPQDGFKVEGGDLSMEMKAPYTVLVLGGEIQVPTPGGKRPLAVLPGTQSGQVLTLSGQGLPALGKQPVGALNVRLSVEIPRDITAEERRLLQSLAALRKDPVK